MPPRVKEPLEPPEVDPPGALEAAKEGGGGGAAGGRRGGGGGAGGGRGMGLWVSKLMNLFGEKEARILVLGLDNAGKTTILCARPSPPPTPITPHTRPTAPPPPLPPQPTPTAHSLHGWPCREGRGLRRWAVCCSTASIAAALHCSPAPPPARPPASARAPAPYFAAEGRASRRSLHRGGGLLWGGGGWGGGGAHEGLGFCLTICS